MPNDNPDWAGVEVGRVDTIRGKALSVATSSVVTFDATFTAPLLYALSFQVSVFNPTLSGNEVQILGTTTMTTIDLLDYLTPAATSMLYTAFQAITWQSAINLGVLLPLDSTYQLQVASGPSTATQAVALTLYAGSML